MSVALLCMPRLARVSQRAVFLCGFAALANVPDMRGVWGHYSYDVRHSLIVNLAIVAAIWLAGALLARLRRRPFAWTIMAFGSAAWLSHLLLDSFYNHGQGVRIFWPLSHARLNLAMPWFSTLHWAWDLHTLRVVAIEAAVYGGLFLICLVIRREVLKRRCARTASD